MRLDSRAFGLASGAGAAALFALCAFAVAVAPAWTTSLASTLIHMDLSGMARTITWGRFFGGLVGWTLLTGLVFAAVSALYNRFSTRALAVARSEIASHRVA